MTADDLKLDEISARAGDLFEKIRRDIAEGGYSPGVALLALLRITVHQLLSSGVAEDSADAFCYYASALVCDFDAGFTKLLPSADDRKD